MIKVSAAIFSLLLIDQFLREESFSWDWDSSWWLFIGFYWVELLFFLFCVCVFHCYCKQPGVSLWLQQAKQTNTLKPSVGLGDCSLFKFNGQYVKLSPIRFYHFFLSNYLHPISEKGISYDPADNHCEII